MLNYGVYLILRGPLPLDPQLIAHRGGAAYAPENTLAAFRRGIVDGADWLEMDVQMTKDGALVVIHDETVDRTTNGRGQVGDLTLAQIRALDAGQGERVPTFDEVLALVKKSGVGLMPEAKSAHLYLPATSPGHDPRPQSECSALCLVRAVAISAEWHPARSGQDSLPYGRNGFAQPLAVKASTC